jgi:hypothetical protein
MSNQTSNNGGLPPQQVSGVPARQGAIEAQRAGDNKQLNLINPTGGRRRRNKLRGGTGSTGNSPEPINPPVVPNTGGSQETRGSQQQSYNQLAGLSGSVNANSQYDKVGGRKKKLKSKRKIQRRRYKTTRNRRAKKYTKSRKY